MNTASGKSTPAGTPGMPGTPVEHPAQVLAARVIPFADEQLRTVLALGPDDTALALITATLDDALYVAVDEATKRAAVRVVYAHSFYAGSNYPSGPLSGEVLTVLAGTGPAEVASGLEAAIQHLETEALFYALTPHGSRAPVCYFPHVVSRCGSYLAAEADVAPGTPLAYLIAPPLEATIGLDAALKAATVTMKKFYAPPTETNFAGALLAGSREACRAAADAFERAVIDTVQYPKHWEYGQMDWR